MSAKLPPKAESVDRQGRADGFVPPVFYRPEVIGGGHTRLTVSLPPERIEAVHRALVASLEPPLKLLYVQLTDRKTGQLPKPRQLVAVELGTEQVLDVLERYRALIYHDGRNQLWVRGALEEQVVLEEISVIYVYPDDPVFREVLEANDVPPGEGETMAERDYIKVHFASRNDPQERRLIQELNLTEWSRGG